MAANTVKLKIRVVKDSGEQIKTIEVDSQSLVKEAIILIGSKVREAGEDYGLYLPRTEYRQSKWLQENKTIEFYTIRKGEVIEFRRRYRPLRVRLPDQSIKSVVIDENMPVHALTRVIAEKNDIPNPEEHSLKLEGSNVTQWLQPSRTLRDQGVEEGVPLVFAQRLHYTVGELDRDNAKAVLLVFEQCHEDVKGGQHEPSSEECIELAALYLQAQFGDSTGDLQWHPEDVLASNCKGGKKVSAAVDARYAQLSGMDATEARYEYAMICRRLPTYGVTFFDVKERLKSGKERDLILGVNKDKIAKYSLKKEVLKEWPLGHVSRFAGTATTFTLDFGSYEAEYVSFITDEGEAIYQVVDGYKKLNAGITHDEYVSNDVVTGTTAVEDIDPNASYEPVFEKKKIRKRGEAGELKISKTKTKARLENAGLSVLGTELEDAAAIVNGIVEELSEQPVLKDVPNEEWRQSAMTTLRESISTSANGLLVSTARCIACTVILDSDTFDHNSLLLSVRDIGRGIQELATSSKALATISSDLECMVIVDTAKLLAQGVMRMVVAATAASAALSNGKVKDSLRDELLTAAQTVGAAAWELLQRCIANKVIQEQFDILLKYMNAVAVAVTTLIASAKVIGDTLPAHACDRVTLSARNVWVAVTQLLSTTKVTAPTIIESDATSTLEASCTVVRVAVDDTFGAITAVALSAEQTDDMRVAVEGVHTALDKLIAAATEIGNPPEFGDLMATAQQQIVDGTSNVIKHLGDAEQVLQFTRETGLAAQEMIRLLNDHSLDVDDEMARKLREAAELLGKHTADMVMAAKLAVNSNMAAAEANALVNAAMELDRILANMMRSFNITQGRTSLSGDFSALVLAAEETGAALADFANTAV